MSEAPKVSHVALFVATLNGGGAERAMVNLANSLACAISKVDLVLGQAIGPFLADVSPDVNVVDLECPRISRALLKLRAYLRDARPQAIISTQVRVNILSVLASRFLPGRPIVVLREANTPSIERRSNSNWVLKGTYDVGRIVYKHADIVIALSDYSTKDCECFYGLPKHKIRRIYNPILDKRLWERAKEHYSHRWLDEKKLLISTMGRVVHQKGLDVLIEAIFHVASDLDVGLLVIGDNNVDPVYYEQLRELIRSLGLENRVDFAGFDPNPFRMIARTDAFVLASRWEGLPGALIQAMELGIPVIATDCPGGTREILQNGSCGTLVSPDDSQALARAIKLTLRKDKPASRSKFTDSFWIEKSTHEYLDVVNGLLQ